MRRCTGSRKAGHLTQRTMSEPWLDWNVRGAARRCELRTAPMAPPLRTKVASRC